MKDPVVMRTFTQSEKSKKTVKSMIETKGGDKGKEQGGKKNKNAKKEGKTVTWKRKRREKKKGRDLDNRFLGNVSLLTSLSAASPVLLLSLCPQADETQSCSLQIPPWFEM